MIYFFQCTVHVLWRLQIITNTHVLWLQIQYAHVIALLPYCTYYCYYSIHGYSDTRGTYGYEYMYSTCNTTVTIVYMDTLTQGVHMGMSTCTVHVIPLLL